MSSQPQTSHWACSQHPNLQFDPAGLPLEESMLQTSKMMNRHSKSWVGLDSQHLCLSVYRNQILGSATAEEANVFEL